MPFLTARWSNLLLFTYAVPPELLRPRLTPDLELDTRDGKTYVSLVAFDFHDTRVLGVPWPGYRNFPEINLRFYVRRGEERGVMFVREFVPMRLVALLARAIYNEPYLAVPMRSHIESTGNELRVEHHFTFGGKAHSIRAVGGMAATCPASDTLEHFFKEHRWGFGRSRRGRGLSYEVAHPTWHCHPVHSFELHIDFAAAYGPQWSILNGREPESVILAAGSEVAVFPKRPV